VNYLEGNEAFFQFQAFRPGLFNGLSAPRLKAGLRMVPLLAGPEVSPADKSQKDSGLPPVTLKKTSLSDYT